MLHLAKVQKNFGSEKTVNFPARKLGNFLWPVKVLKNDEKRRKQMTAAKQFLTQTLGRTKFLKISKRKELSKL